MEMIGMDVGFLLLESMVSAKHQSCDEHVAKNISFCGKAMLSGRMGWASFLI